MGPAFSIPLLIFDWGQPAVAAAAAALRSSQERYAALAVELRSGVRAARSRVASTRSRALYLRKVLLPLRRQIVEETQKPGGPAIVYGIVLILLMFVLPNGVGGLFRRAGQLLGRRRYSPPR